MTKQITIKSLTGQCVTITMPEDQTIAHFAIEYSKKSGFPPGQCKFIQNGQNIFEVHNLTDPITNLTEEPVYVILKLGCGPASWGILRRKISHLQTIIIKMIVDGGVHAAKALESAILKPLKEQMDKLNERYNTVNKVEPINAEDVITGMSMEDTHEWIFKWKQNNQVYWMASSSLIEYVKRFERDGNIKNPYTQENIPEPWRTDFLWAGGIEV